jgi:hypothetical protein
MRYFQAMTLQRDDMVYFKKTGECIRVLKIEIDTDTKSVFIFCDDNQCYHHTAVMKVD